MKTHLTSIGIGVGMAVVGLLLWLTTKQVETPVVTLSKVGIVLVILGVIEIVISGIALAVPSTRHKNTPL